MLNSPQLHLLAAGEPPQKSTAHHIELMGCTPVLSGAQYTWRKSSIEAAVIQMEFTLKSEVAIQCCRSSTKKICTAACMCVYK